MKKTIFIGIFISIILVSGCVKSSNIDPETSKIIIPSNPDAKVSQLDITTEHIIEIDFQNNKYWIELINILENAIEISVKDTSTNQRNTYIVGLDERVPIITSNSGVIVSLDSINGGRVILYIIRNDRLN